jgi:hypothetical protein
MLLVTAGCELSSPVQASSQSTFPVSVISTYRFDLRSRSRLRRSKLKKNCTKKRSRREKRSSSSGAVSGISTFVALLFLSPHTDVFYVFAHAYLLVLWFSLRAGRRTLLVKSKAGRRNEKQMSRFVPKCLLKWRRVTNGSDESKPPP